MKATNLSKGDFIRYENKIFEVVDIEHRHLGRGSANLSLTLKNVQTGQRIEKVFKPDEELEYLDIDKRKIIYQGEDKGAFKFQDPESDKFFTLDKKTNPRLAFFLKGGLEVVGYFDEDDNLIMVELPKIIEYRVISAPPGIKGDTVQGASKVVTIETGYEVKVPLFIKEGDLIRLNTETGEYVERVQS